jgi:hypothetical protein
LSLSAKDQLTFAKIRFLPPGRVSIQHDKGIDLFPIKENADQSDFSYQNSKVLGYEIDSKKNLLLLTYEENKLKMLSATITASYLSFDFRLPKEFVIRMENLEDIQIDLRDQASKEERERWFELKKLELTKSANQIQSFEKELEIRLEVLLIPSEIHPMFIV